MWILPAFGSDAKLLAPPLLVGTNSFYASTLTGKYTCLPPFTVDADNFYPAALVAGSTRLQASLFGGGGSFFTLVVTKGLKYTAAEFCAGMIAAFTKLSSEQQAALLLRLPYQDAASTSFMCSLSVQQLSNLATAMAAESSAFQSVAADLLAEFPPAKSGYN